MINPVRILLRCCLPLVLALSACTPQPSSPGMKLGKPYSVDGKLYYPEYDPTYDKIGEASWYGPGFHGKYTASGEIFNQNDLTAAHPTLPMPSLVRVTNLSNGHSLIVRINDRGPFKSNRIIDLSKHSAQELGIKSIAQVRVQFLMDETEKYLASVSNGGKKKIDMAAYNAKVTREKNNAILNSTEPGDQIVEASNASTHTGQTVNDAAPIVSVNSDDLNTPPETPASKKVDLKQAKPHGELIKQAWAEDEDAEARPEGKAEEKKSQEVTLHEAKAAQVEDDEPAAAEEAPAPEKKSAAPAHAAAPKKELKVSGVWYIQAGSFSQEAHAHALEAKVRKISNVDVSKVDMNEKTWWRVRLGPFQSQEEATEALDKVRAAGQPDARVVHL